MSSESNVTSCLAHMTKPRSQTLDFYPDYESRDVFRDFYHRFYSNAHSISLSFGIFTRYGALVSLHSRSHPQLNIWIARSHWSMFEFLARDFPKTFCTEHIARSILSYTLDTIYIRIIRRNHNKSCKNRCCNCNLYSMRSFSYVHVWTIIIIVNACTAINSPATPKIVGQFLGTGGSVRA